MIARDDHRKAEHPSRKASQYLLNQDPCVRNQAQGSSAHVVQSQIQTTVDRLSCCLHFFWKFSLYSLALIIGTVPQPSLFAADHCECWLRFPDTSQPMAINIAAVKRSQIDLCSSGIMLLPCILS